MRKILFLLVLFTMLGGVRIYAADNGAVLHLNLNAAESYAFPDNRMAFFVDVEFYDDNLRLSDINLCWQMEGHTVGDRLFLHPFGVTLITGASQKEREIIITAIYSEDIYSSASVTIVPSYDATYVRIYGSGTPSFGGCYFGFTYASLFFNEEHSGVYKVKLFSPTPALYIEGSDVDFVPGMGAYITTGEIKVDAYWVDIRINYNVENITQRTDYIAVLAIFDEDGVLFGHGNIYIMFVEPWDEMRQMWLGLPLWGGPTTSSLAQLHLGVPPSEGEFESIITALPMMISGPFVNLTTYWEVEGTLQDDYFDEITYFSEFYEDYVSMGRLHIGESPEEREVTITATWVDNADYYATQQVLVNPYAANIIPKRRYTITAGGEFIQAAIRVWGVPDGVYNASIRTWWNNIAGLRIFGLDEPSDGDLFERTDIQVEVIDGIMYLNMGVYIGNHIEWYTYHFEGAVSRLDFTLYDPSFLEINNWGGIGAEILLEVLPYEGGFKRDR